MANKSRPNETTLAGDAKLTLGPWEVTPAEFAALPTLAGVDPTRQGMMVLAQDGLRFRTVTDVNGHKAFANYRITLSITRDPVTPEEIADCDRISRETQAETDKRKAEEKKSADLLAQARAREIIDAQNQGRAEAADGAKAQLESLPTLVELGQKLATVFTPRTT